MQTTESNNRFVVNTAVNPLIAAAYPLLTLATQLQELTTPPDLATLYTDLTKAIKDFEAKLQHLKYPAAVILAARYFLCAFIDECILKTKWGGKSKWQHHNLLHTFQKEDLNNDRFFIILQTGIKTPQVYIDALELGYICLSLGFLGKFREQEDQLDQIIDHLYEVIHQFRDEHSKKLLISSKSKTTRSQKIWRLPPIWLTILFSIIILVGIFLIYQHHLEKIAQPIQAAIQILRPPHG